MTLLSLVQDACDILSVSRPSSVIAAADQNARTLLSCAQREGKALAKRWAWQVLVKSQTFTSTATEIQSAIPTDFDRMLSNSFFNRTRKRAVFGPLTAQEWEAHTALTAQVLYDAFRLRADTLEMKPIPTAGDTYAFAYVSKRWCQNAAGSTMRDAWAADDDTGLLSEELMTLGVIWRFKQSRGLSWDDDYATYDHEVRQMAARDGARRIVSLDSSGSDGTYPRLPGVPDGSWSL